MYAGNPETAAVAGDPDRRIDGQRGQMCRLGGLRRTGGARDDCVKQSRSARVFPRKFMMKC